MRSDMGKVVIESPRRGSRTACSAKARAYGKITRSDEGYDYEGLTRLPASKRQSRFFPKLGDKDFTDVLGPLRNYLKSSCGRPWNDVYSEIRKTLGHSGWAVEHIIRDHIDVAINTWRGVSGKVWNDSKYGVTEVTSHFRFEFYVEPESGLLRKAGRLHWSRRNRKKPGPIEVIQLSDQTEYRLVDGVWYYQEYRETEIRYFVRNNALTVSPEYEFRKQRDLVEKRQLCKKELRRMGLQNYKRGPTVRAELRRPFVHATTGDAPWFILYRDWLLSQNVAKDAAQP